MSDLGRLTFALRNLTDKAQAIARSPSLLRDYMGTYIVPFLAGDKNAALVVSYPKCGRTWLRTLLVNYVRTSPLCLKSSADLAFVGVEGHTGIRFIHHQGSWVPAPSALGGLMIQRKKFDRRRILFLFRDPRDVLVSSYHHLKYRERIYRHGLSAFVRDDLVGIEKVVSFYNMWCRYGQDHEHFSKLSYEELSAQTSNTLERVVSFFGLPVFPAALSNAVVASSLNAMRDAERVGGEGPWLRGPRSDRIRGSKVRSGKVGGFVDQMDADDLAFVEGIINEKLLPDFPYACQPH